MRQATDRLSVDTHGPGLYEITDRVAGWVAGQGIATGLLTLFIRHTSASLTVQENADPDVRRDLADFFAHIAPAEPGRYRHDAEGPDDMPAHIRAALTATHLSVPVAAHRLELGTWQGLYVFEHRDAGHRRTVSLHLLGQ